MWSGARACLLATQAWDLLLFDNDSFSCSPKFQSASVPFHTYEPSPRPLCLSPVSFKTKEVKIYLLALLSRILSVEINSRTGLTRSNSDCTHLEYERLNSKGHADMGTIER